MKKIFLSIIVLLLTGTEGLDAQSWQSNGANISNSNNGNVGINNTSPQAKLDVSGSVLLNGGSANIDPNMGPLPLIGSAKLLIGWNYGGGSGETDFVADRPQGLIGGFRFYDHSSSGAITSLFTVTGAGNMGIGTTAPNYKLDVNGSANVNGNMSMIGNIVFGSGNSRTNNVIDLPFWTSGNSLTFRNSSDEGNSNNADNDLSVYVNGDLVIQRDPKVSAPNQGRLTVRYGANLATDGGSVGIGTTATYDPLYRLFVETGIRTRKIKVDLQSWPDYVFDSGYRLPTLRSVAWYIQKNGHLPEVPSAATVKGQGIDLGENQAVLLKKIEQLTLYIIGIEKENERQQAEIDGMKKRLHKQTRK